MEARLGKVVKVNSLYIEAGVSVVYPDGLTAGALEQAPLQFAVHQGQVSGSATRWPALIDKWLSGTVDDLADAIELLSLSERLVGEGETRLEEGVRAGSTRLRNLAEGTDIEDRFGQVLHQEPGEQTCRMAIAILTNAFIFHRAVEGHPDIPRTEATKGISGDSVLETGSGDLGTNSQDQLLAHLQHRPRNPDSDSGARGESSLGIRQRCGQRSGGLLAQSPFTTSRVACSRR